MTSIDSEIFVDDSSRRSKAYVWEHRQQNCHMWQSNGPDNNVFPMYDRWSVEKISSFNKHTINIDSSCVHRTSYVLLNTLDRHASIHTWFESYVGRLSDWRLFSWVRCISTWCRDNRFVYWMQSLLFKCLEKRHAHRQITWQLLMHNDFLLLIVLTYVDDAVRHLDRIR
jgi:hypothetical protein